MNKTVLVTRPNGREKNLCQLIENAGGNVIHYPAIKIQSPSEVEINQLKLLNKQSHTFTMAIFISPTAVEQSQRYFSELPKNITVASIGSKTSEVLNQYNIHVDVEASEHNSESLLSSKEFQVEQLKNEHILIFRGQGGRDYLGDELENRGAKIIYAETYKRVPSNLPPLTELQINDLNALTVSSNEGLKNLMLLQKKRGSANKVNELPEQLLKTPLVVPSIRAFNLANQYKFKTIISAQNATDTATMDALFKHFS